jgi:hypothetical protein
MLILFVIYMKSVFPQIMCLAKFHRVKEKFVKRLCYRLSSAVRKKNL